MVGSYCRMGTQNIHPVVSSTPCPLVHLLMCVSVAIQGASQILKFGDLWQRENCILTLPAGIPFRHVYPVFALDTFIPQFSKASLHCPISTYSMPFSLLHSTTPFTNIICQCASFLVCFVNESIMMANRKGLKADPW